MQDEVSNPRWKERVVFRENTDEVHAVDIYIEAGGDPQAPEHVHPFRDERARLVAGSARLILNGEEKPVSAGDVLTIPARMNAGFILDEGADERQREALQTILGGQVGSWPQMFAENVLGEMLGMEFGPIELEIADDLSEWSLNVPGKVEGRTEVLTGPTTRPGKPAHVINIPGSEPGPNSGPMT